jgi:Myb-like DNA-binding domain
MAAQQHGSKWTPEEDLRLLELVEARKSWVFISAKLKRPAKSIRDHFRHLRRQAKKADLDNRPGQVSLKVKAK